jgi:hypothetical protein
MNDPLFDDAPDHGAVRFGSAANVHGYLWKKADGTDCGICADPITGRAFMVAPVRYIRPGESTRTVWRHVRCVTPDEWHAWLGPPRSAPTRGFAPSKPPKNSTRAAAIEAARVGHP